jgi:hypothetical protein
MGFNITKKEPSVTAISVHLQNDNTYQQYHPNTATNTLSTLRHYFLRPLGAFSQHGVMRNFCDLTYVEYFSLFRLAKFDPAKAQSDHYYIEQHNTDGDDGPSPMHVILRSHKFRHYARMREVSNTRGEVFYLRALLRQRPAASFTDLRTIGNVVHASFQQAATALGLFDRHNEAEYALWESIHALKTPAQLRFFFVHLLITDCIPTPLQFWNTFQNHLCFDFAIRYPDAPDYASKQALQNISRLLEEHGKKTTDYQLPEVFTLGREVEHEVQKWAPFVHEIGVRADRARATFNREQEHIFNDIFNAIANDQPLLLFVDGKAGVGKTFLINAICNKTRSHGLIALPTATSGFAAQLYDGGRTLHSTFKVGSTHFTTLNRLSCPSKDTGK